MSETVEEQRLDACLVALEQAKTWPPRLVSRLENHIRTADDVGLYRINVFTFARERNLPETETIDLFLHAAACGLFTMDWSLLCPECCCVVESFRNLKSVHQHYHCPFCQVGYETALDDYIAIGFTVSPEIRKTAFHDLEALSARDRFFKTQNTADGLAPDGTPIVTIKEAHTPVVSYLPPGETTSLEVVADGGLVLATCPDGKAAALLVISGPPAAESQIVDLPYGDKTADRVEREMAPGKIVFRLDNRTPERGAFVISVLPPGFDLAGMGIRFLPFLNGKHLVTMQAFRDLFRSEVVRAREGIGVKDITLLFTDLKGSTALYDRIGDLNAFALVQQHFDLLNDAIVRHRGAVIKTIGDAVMATFLEPADAVEAALSMRRDIAAFNVRQPDRALILKIGIHKGAAIAVTLNERLDYFGQTVNIAARVQQLADADEIFISEDAYADPRVQSLFGDAPPRSDLFKLRGVQEDLRVFYVASDVARAAG